VHLPVFAEEAAVSVEYRASVVVDAGRASLEKGNDEHDFVLFRNLREFFGRGTRYRLRQVEQRRIFLPAKIFAAEKFVQRDDLCAASRCFADFFDRLRKIFFGIGGAVHLHEADGEFVCHTNLV